MQKTWPKRREEAATQAGGDNLLCPLTTLLGSLHTCRRHQVSYGRDMQKGTQELSMLAWRTASLLYRWLLIVVLNLRCEREWREGWWMSLRGDDSRSLRYLAHPDISPLDGEIYVLSTPRTFLWCWAKPNRRIALSYWSILHCNGISDKVLCSRNYK